MRSFAEATSHDGRGRPWLGGRPLLDAGRRGPGAGGRLAAGEDAWNKAGCFECHGTAGEGGSGGEFPAGPSLRESKLNRAALMETISCGRPGTPMPAWLEGAYTGRACYGLPNGPAPAGLDVTPVLSADEIQALLDYLTAKIVGK
jgi:mono/diheme cytochrome c family protein